MIISSEEIMKKVIYELENNSDKYFTGYNSVKFLSIRVFDNIYSTTAKAIFLLDNEEKGIYIKIGNSDDDPRDTIQLDISTEYRILSKLYDEFHYSPHLSVARPVAFFQNFNALVTEEVSGSQLNSLIVSLSRIFSREKQSIVKLETICSLAGNWLGKFHELTRVSTGTPNIDDLILYCDIRLERLCKKKSSGIDGRLREGVRKRLLNLSRKARDGSGVIAGRHNDYSPHNMIYDGDTLTVFDFGFFDHESIYFDIVRFWERLDSLRYNLSIRSAQIEISKQAFLRAYPFEIDCSAPEFTMALIRYRLSVMSLIVDRSAHTGLRNLSYRTFYNTMLKWIKSECKKY